MSNLTPNDDNNKPRKSSSSSEVVKSVREQIKVLKDKDMHQLGNHFNKHGRAMGYASKKEYQNAAIEFAEKCKNNPVAKIMEGQWNGKGIQKNTYQILIHFENRTVILQKETGQLVDFYIGSDWKGLINLITIP